MTVTIDKHRRMFINKATQRELGCEEAPISLYIGYDQENKRIGLAKPDDVKISGKKPTQFDKRGYASVRGFLDKHRLPYDKSYHYVYDGREGEWMTFRLIGYTAPGSRETVKL